MNKQAPSRTRILHPAPKDARSEAQRLHRAINWVVSIILIAFAVWSIQLNSQGRGLFKQTEALLSASDAKLDKMSADLTSIRESCEQAPVVIPVPTTDTQKEQ